MANMSYCRFQNTTDDLDDCLGHIHDELTEDESFARDKLIQLCREVLAEVGDDR